MILTSNHSGRILVSLNEKELKNCDEIAQLKGKKDEWGKFETGKTSEYGTGDVNVNKEGDDYKAERIGSIGEFAFSKITGFPINKEYYSNGDDGWDFEIGNDKIDIKTHQRFIYNFKSLGLYGPFFIKATKEKKHSNENYRFSELRADYYFHCCIDWKNHEYLNSATQVMVKFYGAIHRNDILKMNKIDRLANRKPKNYFEDGTPKWKNYYYKEEDMISASNFLSKYADEIINYNKIVKGDFE